MAQDPSMDIVSQFDVHELQNAFDQAKKEIVIRYDLKDLGIQIEKTDEDFKITAPSEMSLNAAWDILLQKMINRKLSSKILKKQEVEKMGGNQLRLQIKLVKALDPETAKQISKLIRDHFPKAKPSIQGDSVRVTSKSRDELQAVMAYLRADTSLPLPVDFNNFK